MLFERCLLGIANLPSIDARGFSTNVLGLPTQSPIYQQQIVHSTAKRHGPGIAAAEVCGSIDWSNEGDQYTIREISAHDSFFSRRNLSSSSRPNFIDHKSDHSFQYYYVNNEPEYTSFLSSLPIACDNSDCWNPRDRIIDQLFSDVFPGAPPDLTFWEHIDDYFARNDVCLLGGDVSYRIKPDALAFVFLRLWHLVNGTQHVVFLPAALNEKLGAGDAYWNIFFDKIHHGVTFHGIHEEPIPPAQLNLLRALHLHCYNIDPLRDDNITYRPPLKMVAWAATKIRSGVDWYRSLYKPAQPLPLDILLSETGTDWKLGNLGRKFAGGWSNFRDGLLWWNSWLRWLTRRAPYECNLAGWDTGDHALYSCIHEPNLNPYFTQVEQCGNRNVLFYNTDTWRKEYYVNMPVYLPGELNTISPCAGNTYYNSFTCTDTGVTHSDKKTYYLAPFGATYRVWAQIGKDQVTGSLDTGFVYSTQSGLVGVAYNVMLENLWNTIYFVVLKTSTQHTGGQLNCIIQDWDGSHGTTAGCMDMDGFADAEEYYEPADWGPYHQFVYSAMIFPVIVKASSHPMNVRIVVNRNTAGPGIYLSKPIVLKGACSWL